MSVGTEVNPKVRAFMESQEGNQNLTNENLELLMKFTDFMDKHKHEHLRGHFGHGGHHFGHHGHKHGHKRFGKHGHHMFGHHFGKQGPFGRHGMHDKCQNKLDKSEKKMYKNKHFWKLMALYNLETMQGNEPNVSGTSEGNSANQSGDNPSDECYHRFGRRPCRFRQFILASRPVNSGTQTEVVQENNLETLVESIALDSPQKE